MPRPHIATAQERAGARGCEPLKRACSQVVFTGAGISTSTGIPDFRGPNGVWTRQREGQAAPKASVPFSMAVPSLTHQALLALQRAGKLKFLVSQNVDCLHLRSGFPRDLLAELHGNCFIERCDACAHEFVRDFEVTSVGFKRTGRRCSICAGELRDHCLDWEDALPDDELRRSEIHAARADLCLCLGTSLQIVPAADLPFRALRKQKRKPDGGKVAIVNLQATPKDRRASVVIHSPVDIVMSELLAKLHVPIPAYTRTDAIVVAHECEYGLGGGPYELAISLRSVHGAECPIPWLARARLRFEHAATCHVLEPLSGWRVAVPFDAGWLPSSGGPCVAMIELELARGVAKTRAHAEEATEGSGAAEAAEEEEEGSVAAEGAGHDGERPTLRYEFTVAGGRSNKRANCRTFEVVTLHREFSSAPPPRKRPPPDQAGSSAQPRPRKKR